MYVNGKIKAVETIPGMGVEEIKKNGGGSESKIYLIFCKNFSKCHNVPSSSTTIKKNHMLKY
jgi:hypothetical protein